MSDIYSAEIMPRYNNSLNHCFVITGPGTQDLAMQNLMFGSYLKQQLLAGDWDLIVFYDPAHGIRFPDQEAESVAMERSRKLGKSFANYQSMSKRAATILGSGKPILPTGGNALEKAMAAANTSDPSDLSKVKEPIQALDLLDRLMRGSIKDSGSDVARPVKIAVVFESAQVIFPASNQVSMNYGICTIHATSWATDDAWIIGRVAPPLILYIAPEQDELSPALVGPNSRVHKISISAPDDTERESFAAQLAVAYATDVPFVQITPPSFARYTGGLSRLQMEDIVVGCVQSNTALTAEVLRDRKRELMKASYGGALYVEDPRITLDDIAGHEEVKQYFIKLANRLAQGVGLQNLPRGLIFAGPPGTGKTMFAEAVATLFGLNFTKLSFRSQRDMYVGNSEKNLRRAFSLIESMTPVIVFVDELDTQLTSRDAGPTGSSVDGGQLGMFLEFMSDPKHIGKVIVIGATNRPDMIDAAMLRPGRFDALIPLLPGDASNRESLLRIAAERQGKIWDTKIDFGPFLARSEKWTQAELTLLFSNVCEEALDAGRTDKLTQADLDTAAKFTRPSTREVENWSRIAISMCNNHRLLPEWAREIAEQSQDTDEAPSLEPITTPSENGLRRRGRRDN